jgi:hypothetical protein
MDSNYMEEPAHIDLESLEGESEEVARLREAMIELPKERVNR